MKNLASFNWLIVFLCIFTITGCNTKFGRNFEKQVELAKVGVTNTTTNIEKGLKEACGDADKLSASADEVLNLVSSEENTQFTVDNNVIKGKGKQISVCIDSKVEHTVKAKPENCEEKIDKIRPPYNDPDLNFQFMLAECNVASTKNTAASTTRSKIKRKKWSH
jgi:hypothetical protein